MSTHLPDEDSARENISRRIAELADWRGATLARVRELIHEADREIREEWKWRGTPVWSHDGDVCNGETYQQVVKLTFARGACLDDPAQLFNASLEGKVRRAIDLREGTALDGAAFRALIRAAGQAIAAQAPARRRQGASIRARRRVSHRHHRDRQARDADQFLG